MILQVEEIDDIYVKENFRRLAIGFRELPFIDGTWRAMEIKIPGAVTNLRFAHNLPYKPTDVIVTSTIGSPVTFNYSKFSRTHLDITTAGQSTVRILLGSLKT